MNKILIYTEGGHYLGLGNIYRMLELAKSITQANADLDVQFITTSEPYFLDIIRGKGYPVIYVEQNGLAQAISQQEFKVLIIDKLNVDKEFLRSVKEKKASSFKTVLFGNVSDANPIADLVINAIIGTDFTNKKYLDENKTLYLTGPKYLTLREEFEFGAYIHKNHLKNILLLFGGSDQSNFSIKVLRDINNSSSDYNVSIVVGKGYANLEELEALSKVKKATLYKDISNVNEIMMKSDFLITSPGTALFEGFYLGMPCLALFQNESQKTVFRDFFMTQDYCESERVESIINEIYDNFDAYQKRLNLLEIGQGKKEIIKEINNLIC